MSIDSQTTVISEYCHNFCHEIRKNREIFSSRQTAGPIKKKNNDKNYFFLLEASNRSIRSNYNAIS